MHRKLFLAQYYTIKWFLFFRVYAVLKNLDSLGRLRLPFSRPGNFVGNSSFRKWLGHFENFMIMVSG